MEYMLTVNEFCRSHKVSRSRLYELWKEGRGPVFAKLGKRRLISAEAAATWRRQIEQPVDHAGPSRRGSGTSALTPEQIGEWAAKVPLDQTEAKYGRKAA